MGEFDEKTRVDYHGGFVFQAHGLLYHPTLGSRTFSDLIESNEEEERVQKKKKKTRTACGVNWLRAASYIADAPP